MSGRCSGMKLLLLLLTLSFFLDGINPNEALGAGFFRRLFRRGGVSRVQARRGGRRNVRQVVNRRGNNRNQFANRNRFNNFNNNNFNNNNFNNPFDLDRGQVFLNQDVLNNGGVAFLNPNANLGFGGGFNSGVAALGLDPNSMQLVNGSNRLAFVTDRFGRQIPVELRDGAVVNGALVNPSLDSINQTLLTGISGNGIFAGSGQQGVFLPGTAGDIQLFNAGQLRTRGESFAIQPGSFRRDISAGGRPLAF